MYPRIHENTMLLTTLYTGSNLPSEATEHSLLDSPALAPASTPTPSPRATPRVMRPSSCWFIGAETTGALYPGTVRVLRAIHEVSKNVNAACDSTVYGAGRALTRRFFVHH